MHLETLRYQTGYNRNLKWLKEVKIEYPSPNKQQEIVEVLDRITKIIQERKLKVSFALYDKNAVFEKCAIST